MMTLNTPVLPNYSGLTGVNRYPNCIPIEQSVKATNVFEQRGHTVTMHTNVDITDV